MQLVFLHAFPLNTAMWNQQMRIAPGRTVCPSLYSMGSTLSDWAEAVLALTDPEEPIVAIGSSMGGSCAIEMARQSSKRIAALVLVGTAAGHRPDPELRARYIASLRADGANGVWPELSNCFCKSTCQKTVDFAFSIANAQATEDLINAVRVFHSRPDLEHVLQKWKKPYLVIAGDSDPMVSMQKSERMSKLGQNGKLQVMNGCGHFMNMEQPEEFNRIITNFIATENSNVVA